MRSAGPRWGAALALIGALERVVLRAVYSPVAYGDTPSYLRLASNLGEAGLAGYDATRVPGYPLFLLVLGGEPERIWLAQMALGWAIALLLFWIGWRTTGSARFGFALGMLYNLIPGLVLFEANLLSETLTMFCVTLSLALLFVGARKPSLLPMMGFASAAAGLVRALFYPLAPWLALFVARLHRRWLLPMALFAVPAALLLGGWVGTVYRQYEMLSPTTMSGYHLVQHTGEYFELLPDEHATIRDTYLKYRDARVAERGVQTNAIWDAIPELTEVTGLSFFALSAEMQRLSLELIVAHPGRYLANVVEGWIDFWKAPAVWDPAAVQVAALEPVFRAWVLAGRGFSLAANALFLALSGLALSGAALAWVGGPARFGMHEAAPRGQKGQGRDSVAGAPLRGLAGPQLSGRAFERYGGARRVGRRVLERLGVDWVTLASAGLVWWTSIVQTLVDHGDNPRFLVPLQIVVIFVVLRAGWSWMRSRGEQR